MQLKNDNLLYGLHALNNLDKAVNGSQFRRQSHLPFSESSFNYSPPPKPPRRTPTHSSHYLSHHYDRPSSELKIKKLDSSGEGDSYLYSEETSSEQPSEQPSTGYDSPSRAYHYNRSSLTSPSEVLSAQRSRRENSPSIDDDDEEDECQKENFSSYKTRISVSGTPQFSSIRPSSRKPFKTTINTANDAIQYRQDSKYFIDSQHYKVPKTQEVVSHYVGKDNNNQFTSTRLVRNVETRRNELDREGRSIRRHRRTYSGCSTSPDRDNSPSRYSKPRVKTYNRLSSSVSEIPIHRLRERRQSFSRENNVSDNEDRFSRFTEYKGDERERGQSLPPGASIDSMRDFYKSSKFKSLYALPPNRPAPILISKKEIGMRKKMMNTLIPKRPSLVPSDNTPSEYVRRWSVDRHSVELDSDYRRELANSSNTLTSESRSKPSFDKFTTTLERRAHRKNLEGSLTDDDLSLCPIRDEERRKVLEIEKLHARNGTSGQRINKVLSVKKPRAMDHESNYSGSSVGGLSPVPKQVPRYDRSLGRIKRSTSTAASNSGVRREINRKKIPSSATSSLNSSESGELRSVYLHTAAVADIPNPGSGHKSRRTVSENREEGSNLQKSSRISRSISLLAPWKPNNYKDKFEIIHYDNNRNGRLNKPPRPPPVMIRDKKSASSLDLMRSDERPERIRSTLPRKPPLKVSRSVSIPKDTRLAGWFKKRKKV